MKEVSRMKYVLSVTTATLFMIFLSNSSVAENDSRQIVKFPEMMQQHMLANMRDHLEAINEILLYIGNDELDKAAEVAEKRLGMSAMDLHGAKHQAKLMPEGMRKSGSRMHHAASRFALKAEEGEPLAAYKSLQEITNACVACHAAYRVN